MTLNRGRVYIKNRIGFLRPPGFVAAGFFMGNIMKHGYMKGHKEAAGAYGLDKAVKVKINAKNPFAHKKWPAPRK